MSLKFDSPESQAQAALDHFGFIVVGWTHEEDAARDTASGFLEGETWCGNFGYTGLIGKVIGPASIGDWRRQEQFYGDEPTYVFRAFRKVVAE